MRGFIKTLFFVELVLFCALLSGCPNVAGKSERELSQVILPPGFHIDIYADNIPGARSLSRGPGGTIFVGSRDLGGGSVYALTDQDGDQHAETVRTLISGLEAPNGVAVHDGSLFVAEARRIIRFHDIENHLDAVPAVVEVHGDFPNGQHSWKYLRFGPDGLLYFPIGMPCDLCEAPEPQFGTIMRMKPDGSELSIFASGIRNTVGFDFHPGDGELWFTDNGPDKIGDDEPPDELNAAPGPGLNFGFPYCLGGDLVNDKFGNYPCENYTPPRQKLGAHVAALGMVFYTGDMFPPAYRGQIFIAEHGSAWRDDYLGYRVTLVRLEGERGVSYEPFVDGFLRDGESFARPVDLLVMPDGALLLSDDRGNAVYRISYKP